MSTQTTVDLTTTNRALVGIQLVVVGAWLYEWGNFASGGILILLGLATGFTSLGIAQTAKEYVIE